MLTFLKKLFIPKGLYCYKPIKVITREDGMPVMKTKPCPFYKNTDVPLLGYCELKKCDVWDAVKECGINEGWEEIEEDFDF